MLIALHMFSLSVVCILNTQLKLLPFKRYTVLRQPVLRQPVNGNFNLTPTVYYVYTLPLNTGFFTINSFSTPQTHYYRTTCQQVERRKSIILDKDLMLLKMVSVRND